MNGRELFPIGHLEKPRFLAELKMQLFDLTDADFSKMKFFEMPNSGFSAQSAVEPSLERHRFAATSSSRTRVTAAHQRPEKLQRFSARRRVRSVQDDAQLAPVGQ